jgi:transposase
MKQFIGIDLHTNRFTCCYREEGSADRRLETFELDTLGLALFYRTLTAETHVLVEATITTFSFVRLFHDRVKEVIIANTYELKQVSLARKNTDKIDAEILCRILKAQVLSGERLVCPVTLPPKGIQDLRGLYSTYRLYKKQIIQLKNRIHSLLKEALFGFTQEEIFGKKNREKIRGITEDGVLKFQVNQLLDLLGQQEAAVEGLKDQVLIAGQPYMAEIDILASMKGVSVFIAIAIVADVIDISRFKNSKHFSSYLRSAPRVSNSNTSTRIGGTNKKGRKLASTLLAQSLNHVLDSSGKLRAWYDRLCEGKKAGLVRTALRRRVLTEIYQMLKKGEYHYGREPEKHKQKMAQYRAFLKKQS